MRNLIITLAVLTFTGSAYSQRDEFKVYSNGLIYNEQTMNKLSHIVDSLNLKFKTCNFNNEFYAESQTIGHLVKLKEGNINQAKEDMEKLLPFDDFIKKYPEATIEKNVLILKYKSKNYDDEEIVKIQHFDLRGDYGYSITSTDISLYKKDLTNKWLFRHADKTNYSEESLTAFYFPSNFASAPLPKKYSNMIGYSDCLIDTTTTKFKEKTDYGHVELPNRWKSLTDEEKALLLDKMRSTRVVGMCSMDNSPREHAVNIALLSAETAKWEVFLKAHLDIMNDRFDRLTDGSYAWGKRSTYIKELEELDINVVDLILGISFRVENPATNHYYGSIGRIGRALSETKNRNEIEQAILSIISDTELDYYNRVLFYFLFERYNDYTKDDTVKKENKEKLEKAISTFPDFIKTRLMEK